MSTATAIDPKIVKELRDRTNAGMMDCKKPLRKPMATLKRQ
jgi:translation elongation factor EF-Ts